MSRLWRMITICGALLIVGAPFGVWAGTTAPPNLTITESGKKPHAVAVFDKWTDGATAAIGDLGTDGIAEIVVGAGPGSAPEIRTIRRDGSLIKKFNAFDARFRGGLTVAVGDIDGDGVNDIVAGAGPGGGPHVRIFDGTGILKYEFFPFPADYRGGIEVAASGGRIAAAQLAGVDRRVRTYAFVNGDFALKLEVPRANQTADDALAAAADNLAVSVPAPHFTNDTPELAQEIIIDLSEQRLYAFDHGALATTFLVSTGNKKYPTLPGNFRILRKIAKMDYRWSYGPGNPDNYELKNVHWNSQFTAHQYIHEAYWHNAFGTVRSHGCVNSRLNDAKFIYDWVEVGTPVTVRI